LSFTDRIVFVLDNLDLGIDMKQKILNIGVLLVMLFVAANAMAAVEIKNISEIEGIWVVEATAPSLQRKKKAADQTWEFKGDGTVTIISKPHWANSAIKQTTTFTIENNLIKIARPGRPGKFDRYQIYEKQGNNMVLKGGMEGFYFMVRK